MGRAQGATIARADDMNITHYFDVTVRRGSGVNSNVILSRLLSNLHEVGGFAIHFPSMRERDQSDPSSPRPATLGDTLRLFGEEALMRALQGHRAIEALSDYIETSRVAKVGRTSNHVIVKRSRNLQWSPAERARRKKHKAEREKKLREIFAARGGEGRPHAPAPPAGDEPRHRQQGHLPHLALKSRSTGKSYIVDLVAVPAAAAVEGEFDNNGLSRGVATVPVF